MKASSKPVATLSLDLDNLWCYQRSFGIGGWTEYPSFLETAVPRFLDILENLDLKITVFIVGKDATESRHSPLLARISEAGHSVGNHSFHHQSGFPQLPASEIFSQLQESKQAIESATQQSVVGFRGPSFGLSRNLLDVLINEGYHYDASTCPSSIGALARMYHRVKAKNLSAKPELQSQQYGSFKTSQQRLTPYLWKAENGTLVELPVTTMPLLKLPFHGTYLQYLADYSPALAAGYFRVALKLCALNRITPSFLLHATDFIGAEDPFATHYLPGMKRSASKKCHFIKQILTDYRRQYSVETLEDFALRIREDGEKDSFEVSQFG